LAEYPGIDTDTDVVIKDILTEKISISNSDQSNIDATGLNAAGWIPLYTQPDVHYHEASLKAGDAIAQLAEHGNKTTAISAADFYFVQHPLVGSQLRKPLPYLKRRLTDASPDFMFARKHIAPGGLKMSRNIWNLIRNVWIGSNRSYGTHTGSNGSSTLVDSTANFATWISPGDRVINITKFKLWTVQTVNSATQLSFIPMTGDIWDNGNEYAIEKSRTYWKNTGTSTRSDLWTTDYIERRSELSGAGSTGMDTYGDWLLELYEQPVQQQSFVLGSHSIWNGYRAHVPLWRPLGARSFYFRAVDLDASYTVFTESEDRQRTFLAVAMDYTYKDNRLRIVPSTGDSRLDVLLAQANLGRLKVGQMISTLVEEDRAIQAERRRLYRIGREHGVFLPETPDDMTLTQLRHFLDRAGVGY